ncbi:MAG: DUF3300 domain-containing protein [Bryobacterales bacterium]|nr:DUF3300 domain-containing protein [Bryobacterales bacterium]
MNNRERKYKKIARYAAFALGACVALPAFGQYGPPPSFQPEELDRLVGQVALYPDPLLAHVLTASTYPEQIPGAASWSSQHRYLSGEQLARAIVEDRLPWDYSVQALLPFPNVLDMMAGDMGWTQQLANAVLADRVGVMDAVQRMRRQALDNGYLRSSPEERVAVDHYGQIQILPAQDGYYYVPVYDPRVVYVRPRPGIRIGVGITFGPRIFLGAAFAPYGWAGPGFDWRAHTVIIDRRPWERTWANRQRYEYRYTAPPPRAAGPRVERHEREVKDHGERGQGKGKERERGREHERRQ